MALGFAGSAQAFCQDQPDAWCHADITREALGFLRSWVVRALAEHADDPDDLNFIDRRSAHHFDDCNFNGGVASINDRYRHADPTRGVLAALSPLRRFVPGFTFPLPADHPRLHDGLKAWGFALHGAQDFYAHSNWIEMGLTSSSRIVDRRLGAWRAMSADWGVVRGDLGDGFGDVLTSQLPLPAGWSMTYPGHPYVPIVIDAAGRMHHLLVSGEAGWFEACPAGARLSHDTQLNKDDPVPPPGSLQSSTTHVQAATMAIHQTRHEWCRLQRMMLAEHGPAGAGVVMGLLADPRRAPHPPESVCAPAPRGPVQVTVSVTRLRVLNDKESDGPGQLNFVLSAFSESMRRSAARQSLTVVADTGTLVPAAQLPAPVSLCMQQADRLVATLQGWEDDGADERGELSLDDDLLNGASVAFGPVSGLPSPPFVRTVTRRSDNEHAPDVEVTFRVTRSSPLAPAPACTSPPVGG